MPRHQFVPQLNRSERIGNCLSQIGLIGAGLGTIILMASMALPDIDAHSEPFASVKTQVVCKPGQTREITIGKKYKTWMDLVNAIDPPHDVPPGELSLNYHDVSVDGLIALLQEKNKYYQDNLPLRQQMTIPLPGSCHNVYLITPQS